MNVVLRTRWLWLQRVDESKPRKELNIQVPQLARHLFEGSTFSVLGDGASTFFCSDSWLPSGRISDIAPNLFVAVPKRTVKQRRVREGLAGGWLEDLSPDLGAPALMELLDVADRLVHVTLVEGVEDSFRWRWENNNSYSVRSCYEGMFGAREDMASALQIWKSRAPSNCRVFMWLAARNRCWTTDRLSRCGLPHPASCPFCDQGGETLDHLLMGCVLAREVWSVFLRLWGMLHWMPQPDTTLVSWLRQKKGGRGGNRDLWMATVLIC